MTGDSVPLVTVVIPTWNRKVLLGEAIESVLAQTYPNLEVIVADDGSTDGTLEAVSAHRDPRIRCVALKHSGNISYVRNRGAEAGTGPLIAFLDSDDLWLPEKIERQVDALCSAAARWCYTKYTHVDPEGASSSTGSVVFRPDNGCILSALMLEQTTACVCTLLIERTLFEELGGFDESFLGREDLDLAFRLAAAADAVAVPAVMTLVREHSGRTTAAVNNPHELSARVYEKFLTWGAAGLHRAARARLSQLLIDAGIWRIRRREMGTGLLLLVKAASSERKLATISLIGRRLVGAMLASLRQRYRASA